MPSQGPVGVDATYVLAPAGGQVHSSAEVGASARDGW